MSNRAPQSGPQDQFKGLESRIDAGLKSADQAPDVDTVKNNPNRIARLLAVLAMACANPGEQPDRADAMNATDTTVEAEKPMYEFGDIHGVSPNSTNSLEVYGNFIPGSRMNIVFYGENADILDSFPIEITEENMTAVNIQSANTNPVGVIISDDSGQRWDQDLTAREKLPTEIPENPNKID